MTKTITTMAGAAGRISGTAARGLIWAHQQIDWAEVGAIVLHGLQLLIVLTLLAGRATRQAWDLVPVLSEQLGRWYSGLIVRPEAASIPAPVIPAATPVLNRPAPAAAQLDRRQQLEALSCRQLRELTGIRRKVAKRQLIELALAA